MTNRVIMALFFGCPSTIVPGGREMKRRKTIPTTEFEEVFQRCWEPVVLVGDAVPQFAENIPACCIIASGERISDGFDKSGAGRLVGGIDVYRDAPDDPVALNKDWYAIISTDDTRTLGIDGPKKDKEHWLDEIPARYAGAEIVGSSSRTRE